MRTCYKPDKHDRTFHSCVHEQGKPGFVWTSTKRQDRVERKKKKNKKNKKTMLIYVAFLANQNLAGVKKSLKCPADVFI